MHEKKKYFWSILVLIILGSVLALFYFSRLPTTNNILYEKGYTIQNQEKFNFTMSIPNSALSKEIYLADGKKFKKNEIIVYQTDTISIYLEKIIPTNCDEGHLYFFFNCKHKCPKSGKILLTKKKSDQGYSRFFGLSNNILKTNESNYENSVFLVGGGPEEQFMLDIPADICKNTSGSIKIDAYCNCITYAKNT